jgi:hypothetical protein
MSEIPMPYQRIHGQIVGCVADMQQRPQSSSTAEQPGKANTVLLTHACTPLVPRTIMLYTERTNHAI